MKLRDRQKAGETHSQLMMRQIRRGLITKLRTMQSREMKIDLTAWGHRHLPHYFTHPPSTFHSDLGKALPKIAYARKARAVYIGPRGNAKSTYLSFLYPLCAICEEWEKYITLIADTGVQARSYLNDISDELMGNEELAKHYPEVVGEGPVWNAGRIVTRNGICVEALGIGSKIRGRKFKQHRPTCIIIDDPEGYDAAYSDLKRDRVWARITRDIFKAGSPTTNILAAGTNLHRQCSVARLSKMPGWRAREYKSIVRWPNDMNMWDHFGKILADITRDPEELKLEAYKLYADNKEQMDAGSEVLWPEYEPLVDLMFERETGGHMAFEAEKQNNPVDPATCEWGPENFALDRPDSPLWFDQWPSQYLCKVMAVDPSKGRQDRPGDYQAIIKLMVGKDANMYWDADIARRPMPDFVEMIFNHIEEFQPDVCVCESNQFQELIIHEVEEIAKKRALLAPIEGMENYADPKIVRIRRMSPYITRGRFRYYRKSRGIILFQEQTLEFPNGRYDDGPDAAEMAVRRAAMLLSKFKRFVRDPR